MGNLTLFFYGQSPAPDLKPRVGSQLVPVFVQVILAAPAASVGTSIIVYATPAEEVAPVITEIMPSVTDVTAVMFLVRGIVGMP